MRTSVFLSVFLLISFASFSQFLSAFGLDGKWGYKNGDEVVIPAQYDTALAFDQTNQVAAVGRLVAKSSLGTVKREYTYSFITISNRKIYIRPTYSPDSVCEFSMSKNLLAQYMSDQALFTVNYAGRKFIINKKTGKQLGSAIDNLYSTPAHDFFLTEIKEKTGQTFVGLIDGNGKQIIYPAFSRIVINTNDSLIICCTAGIKASGSDDVYNFKGQRLFTSQRHLDYAYRNYTIYKLHEPEILYIIQSNADKKERPLKANWAYYLAKEVMVFRHGKDKYYFYNIKEDKKIPLDGRIYWLLNLNDE